jgi:hypothetical protein
LRSALLRITLPFFALWSPALSHLLLPRLLAPHRARVLVLHYVGLGTWAYTVSHGLLPRNLVWERYIQQPASVMVNAVMHVGVLQVRGQWGTWVMDG